MMGNTTLAEIERALNTALVRDRQLVESWLDEEFTKPTHGRKRDAKVMEDLVWVRDALRAALKKKATRGAKAKKSKGKKKPAA